MTRPKKQRRDSLRPRAVGSAVNRTLTQGEVEQSVVYFLGGVVHCVRVMPVAGDEQVAAALRGWLNCWRNMVGDDADAVATRRFCFREQMVVLREAGEVALVARLERAARFLLGFDR
jgi:hypothetical protein